MNEEEKFDELLSSKLSERDFPFDELNWDEAERLLIQQESRRRVTRFTLIFSAGLAAGVLVMLPFIINTRGALINPVATTSTAGQNTVTQKTIPSAANQSALKTNTTIHTNETAPLPVQSAFVKKDNSTGFRSTYSHISPIASKSEKNRALLLADRNSTQQKLPAESSPVAPADKTGNAEAANHQQIASYTPKTTEANSTTSNTTDKTEKTTSANTNVTENNTTTAAPASIPTVTVAANKTPSDNNSKPKTDSAINVVNSPPPSMLRGAPNPYVKSDAQSSNILSVYAGGNYSFGWRTGGLVESTSNANGITPWGGFDFTHYFGTVLSASLGIGYSELDHLNQTYTSSIVQYDFGVNASATNVSPQEVYYLAFPLKLQFNIDNKNMFGIGADYLLMLTTSSTLTTYQQTSLSENPPTSIKQNGYTQGFSNSDIQLTFSYTRMLTGRLGIGAEYYYDFNYIENNTIPGINQSVKNMGIRLVLSYQLMK